MHGTHRFLTVGLALVVAGFPLIPGSARVQDPRSRPAAQAGVDSHGQLLSVLGGAGDDCGYADRVREVHLGPDGLGIAEGALDLDPEQGALHLGRGGHVVADFVDNVLVNSGDLRPDLVLLGQFGSVRVALLPADTATWRALRSSLAREGQDGFFEVGSFQGSPVALDLDAFVRTKSAGVLRFRTVRVRDSSEEAQASSGSPTVAIRPAVLDGILAASTELEAPDVVSRELSVQLQSADDLFVASDAVSREMSLQVQSGADAFLPLDVVSRELSVRIDSFEDLFLPTDVVSRELSLEVQSTDDLFLPRDVVSRELSIQRYSFEDEGGPLDAVSRELSVFVPGGADLRVISIVAPASGQTDEPVTLSWLVRNVGNAPTPHTWIERISLSPDPAEGLIAVSEDVLVTGALAPGENKVVTHTMPVSAPPGTYWVVAETDAANVVAEEFGPDSETNNVTVSTQPIVVTQAPRPALEVRHLTPPPAAGPNETIEIVWWTHNAGTDVAVAPWTESIVLAPGPRSGSSSWLGMDTVTTSLAPGESLQRIVQVTLPAVLPPESWLIVCTNAGSELILLPGTETCAQKVICPTCLDPDAVPSLVTTPAQAEAGQQLAFSYTVTNAGDGTALAPWSDRLSLVRESDGVVVSVAEHIHAADLDAGAPRIVAAGIPVPAGADGAHRVRIELDAENQLFEPGGETNNLALASQPTSIVQPSRPDLVVDIATVSETTAHTGESVQVQWHVANTGSADAVAPWQDAVYLSSQPVFDLSTAEVRATYTNATTLVLGAGYPSSIERTIVMPQVPGTYWLFAGADALGDVEEGTGEANNVAPAGSVEVTHPPRPNLTVDSLTAPQAGPVGSNADVSWVVHNMGEIGINAGDGGPTDVQWNERIYASTDAAFGNDLLLSSSVFSTALPVGGMAARTRSVPIPPMPAGYFVIVQVDSSNAISETDESDNVEIAATPSSVVLPNLGASAVSHPADGVADAPVTVTWTVTNGSPTATAASPWIDTVYLRPLGTSALQPLGSSGRLTPLGPGAQYIGTLTTDLPGYADGGYDLLVVADSQNVVVESDQSDNTALGGVITIGQPPRPNIVVESVETPADGLVHHPFTAAWRIKNDGDAPVTAPFVHRVYGVNQATGAEHLLAFTTTIMPLAIGQQVDLTVPATMPPFNGTYRLAVVTDATNAVNEGTDGGEGDNRLETTATFVSETYAVTAVTAVSAEPMPTTVPITGLATTSIRGLPVAGVPVDVAVDVQGSRRVLPATTEANGTFAIEFQPLSSEAGRYDLRAGPRGLLAPAVTDSFVLYGMSTQPGSRSIDVFPGFRASTTAFVLKNHGDTPLSGIAAETPPLPPGLTVTLALDATDLSELGSTLLQVSIEAATSLAPQDLPVVISLTSLEGAAASATLDLSIRPPDATLVSTAGSLNAAMELPGQDGLLHQTLVELSLTNIGAGVSEAITVLPPALPWLAVATEMPLPPLLPGATTVVTFVLTPTAADVPPGATATGNVAVLGGHATLFVPFAFQAFQAGQGSIEVRATDEGTYWGTDGQPLADGPAVGGATVTVREHFTQQIVGQEVTGASGTAHFEALPPGYYHIRTDAPGHGANSIVEYLSPGEQYEREAFLPILGVSYTWSVVPTEIEDQYLISVNVGFQTFVPAPVITISPVYADLDALSAQHNGEPFQIDYTVTNHGLIRADDVTFSASPPSGYTLTALATELGDILPGQTVTIPVIVTAISAQGGTGCQQGTVVVEWTLVCGVPLPYAASGVVHAASKCPPPVPPSPLDCGGSGSGSGPGGGDIIVPPTPNTTHISCDPDCFASVLGCILPDCAGAVFTCGREALCHATELCDVEAGDIVDCVLAGAVCLGSEFVAKWLFPPAKLDCVCDLITSCLLPSSSILSDFPCSVGAVVGLAVSAVTGDGGDGPGSVVGGQQPPEWHGFLGSSPEPTKQFAITQAERLAVFLAVQWYPFGSDAWLELAEEDMQLFEPWRAELVLLMDSQSEEGTRLSAAERGALHALPRPSHLSSEDLELFFARWNRTVQYWEAGIRTVDDVPSGFDTDFIDQRVLSALWNAAWDAVEGAQADGFDGVLEAWTFAENLLDQTLFGPQQGICATVEVQIDQTVAVARNAFRASLSLENSSDQMLEAVEVLLDVQTTDGQPALPLFALQLESLSGIPALNGSAALPQGTSLSAEWLLIPSDAAAPVEPVDYQVSGSLSFVRNGVFTYLPLTAISIEVLPNAQLQFAYFIERDVYADDPFTPVQEPSVPFDLGLVVTNDGAGSTSSVTVTSAQPVIVDNDQGLLIDFAILGSQVGAAPASPSLTANLGGFSPGQTNTARWQMTSSLQGKFISFQASVENLNGLDDPEFWVIDPVVQVRPMLRAVRADNGIEDGIFDFLEIDPLDPIETIPEWLWTSTGTVEAVSFLPDPPTAPVTGEPFQILVDAPVDPEEWTYIRLADPFDGQYLLTGVVRSDGKSLLLGPNAWQTDRILRQGPSLPAPRVHLFDRGGDGEYTLFFDADVVGPRVTGWSSNSLYGQLGYYPLRIDPAAWIDPRIGGPMILHVLFSEAIDAATFVPGNVYVTLNANTDVGISVGISTALLGDGSIGEIILAGPIQDRSRLCVTLDGVEDLAGNPLDDQPSRIVIGNLVADLDEDGIVTPNDVSMIEALLGTNPIDPGVIVQLRADLDRDGKIDAIDKAIAEARLGQTLAGAAAACLTPFVPR